MLKIFRLLLFFSWSFTHLFAEELPLLSTSVDKAIIKTNESLTFTIKLKKDKKLKELLIPEVGDKILGLRIVDYGQKGPLEDHENENNELYERWYLVEANLSGDYVLPAIKISYQTPEGEKKELSTSEIFIQITGEKKPEENSENPKSLRPIKDIYRTPIPYVFIFSILGGVVLIIAISWYLWRFWHKREVKVKKLSPYEKLQKEFDELKNWKCDSVDHVKKYYFKLTDILKSFYEEEFFYPATDRTYTEIKRDIYKTDGPSDDQKKIFLEILEKAENVKYADFFPQEDFNKNILDLSSHFVELARPIEKTDTEDSVI